MVIFVLLSEDNVKFFDKIISVFLVSLVVGVYVVGKELVVVSHHILAVNAGNAVFLVDALDKVACLVKGYSLLVVSILSPKRSDAYDLGIGIELLELVEEGSHIVFNGSCSIAARPVVSTESDRNKLGIELGSAAEYLVVEDTAANTVYDTVSIVVHRNEMSVAVGIDLCGPSLSDRVTNDKELMIEFLTLAGSTVVELYHRDSTHSAVGHEERDSVLALACVKRGREYL